MDLSIIIVNYRSPGFVRQCLESLYTNPPTSSFEAIVVDNNSGDGSVEMVKQFFPQTKVITLPKNRGWSAGNNAGIKTSSGRYILLCNPDITFLPGSLDKLLAYLQDHPKVGLLGPKLVNPDESIQETCRSFITPLDILYRRTPLHRFAFAQRRLNRYLLRSFDHQTTRPVDWLQGSCIIFPRQLYDQIEGLDERYFLFLDDTDLARTIWQLGYQVHYYPLAEMIHNHRRLTDGHSIHLMFRRVTWIHILSAIKYFRKWGLSIPKLPHHERN